METGLLHTHNLLRWAILLFALLTLVTAVRGLNGKKEFTNGDKRTALYLLICADLQLLLGLGLYFMRGWSHKLAEGAETMHNSIQRFWAVEHAFGMILAIILIHVGYAGTKGNRPQGAKFRRLFWCVLIATVIVVAMMPWPFREAGIAKGWFPGMAA